MANTSKTEDAPERDAAADVQPVLVASGPSNTSRWVLTSLAGVGLLGLGLLGGILIGQQVGPSTAQDRGPAAHITVEHPRADQREQRREHARERLQDLRDKRELAPGPQQPAPQQPDPAPSPEGGGE